MLHLYDCAARLLDCATELLSEFIFCCSDRSAPNDRSDAGCLELACRFAGHRLAANEPACKPDSVPVMGGDHPSGTRIAVRLGATYPLTLGEQPVSAGLLPKDEPLLVLLPVGFTEPSTSPTMLVSSYLTVSPLPALPHPKASEPLAVCSLWHCPARRRGWLLATTVLCGVRTFLSSCLPRPPGQLIRDPQSRATATGRRRSCGATTPHRPTTEPS